MKSDLRIVAEIPCFKCLFWEWKKDSHLYCNPNECQKLTDWILKQADECQQKETVIAVVSAWHARVSEKPEQ